MNHVAVKSSNVKSIAYDPASKAMEVKFSNGGTYRYEDVSAFDHALFVNAKSLGGHFAKHINGKFKHTQVGRHDY